MSRRILGAGFIFPIVVLLAYAAPVDAANNIVVQGIFGDCQFSGVNAGANKVVKIEWRDGVGNLKSKQSVTSNASGQFTTLCEFPEVIATGDVLKTTIGTSVRSFTLPKVTANVDRIGDSVSGKVSPTPNALFVDVRTYDGGFSAATGSLHESQPVPVAGTYATSSWDTAPDIKGWDAVAVTWQDASGDQFVRLGTAPAVRVWERESFINVVGNPRAVVDVSLSTSGSVLRDEVTGRIGQFGTFSSQFLDADGDGLTINAGDKISATFAADANFSVPTLTATPNKTTDKVVANCGLASVGVEVDVYTRDESKASARAGFTDGSGSATANFATSPAFNIVSGTKVDVYCKLGSGDVVARTFTVL